MGAKVLDNARIGYESLVAAGAVVREGFEVPPGSLVAGVPAKVQRELGGEERERLRASAGNYLHYVREYRKLITISNRVSIFTLISNTSDPEGYETLHCSMTVPCFSESKRRCARISAPEISPRSAPFRLI
jgi:hypothetical protein